MTDWRALIDEIRADSAPLDAYAGRSLADAFAAVVLRDARFYAPMRATIGRMVRGMTCASGSTGLVWPSRSGLWPVRPGWYDLVAGWFDPDVIRHGVEVDADGEQLHKPWADVSPEPGDVVDPMMPFHDAADVVAALLGRFLAPLRDGRVAASGHAASGSMALGPISPAVWSRPATRFDAVNSGVARWTGWAVDQSAFAFRAKRFRFEVTAPEFEAVTLDLVDAAPDEKPTGGRRGRPRTVPYEEAMSRVYARIDRDGFPKNGTELCDWLGEELQKIEGWLRDTEKLRDYLREKEQSLYRYAKGRTPK